MFNSLSHNNNVFIVLDFIKSILLGGFEALTVCSFVASDIT